MKYFAFYLLMFIAACGNDNSSNSEQADNPGSKSKKEASTVSVSDDGLVGEWEMVGSIVDTNDNLQIDDDERKNLKPSPLKDYMKLNSDGTGLFTVAKMEGRYEAKAKEDGGKQYLTWYDRANGPHPIGTIISVTRDELHIKEPGGYGLFIWKRI